MSRRNNLGLAEIVAEKMEDLDLLGEYTMYEFLGKTLCKKFRRVCRQYKHKSDCNSIRGYV